MRLGGVRIDSGLDINNDQILAAGEIEATSYVCSGVSDTGGTDTPNITASGFVLPEDAIYVVPNAVDGTDLKNAIMTALTDTPDNSVIVLPAGDFIVSSSKPLDDLSIKEDYVMEYRPIKWIRISDDESFEPENWPLTRAVHAVAGIGNPSKFYNLLNELFYFNQKKSSPEMKLNLSQACDKNDKFIFWYL